MARALPFHVQQLFALLQTLGWSQKRCAAALGLTPQAINNWASGGMNVPARYRGPLASLVTLTISQALAPVSEQSPDVLEQRTQVIDHFITQWFLENQEARGVDDTWHTELGRKLDLAFKRPLSRQGVEDLKAELALHLEAAQHLRRLIQRHEMATPPPTLAPSFRPQGETPASWFWFLAEYLAGEPLQKSKELTQWEGREFQQWIESLPADKRAGLEAMRTAGTRKAN
jgi:transcriptional regulator with XRE-family HTH domain